MRRIVLVLLAASVACGTSSTTNAEAPQAGQQPRPAGSGYEDATPLSETAIDSPMGAPTSSSPTVATVGSQFSTSGSAAIVRGDVVRAREQALSAALQSAVQSACAQIGRQPTRDVLNHARSYIKRYSITREQNDPDASYTIDVDAEVDTTRLIETLEDGSGGSAMANNPEAGAPSISQGTVHMVLLTVHRVRRARDLRGVAELLRADSRVREVRQQLYKQQRAILEVDIVGTGEDVARIIEPFATEDGVSLIIDKHSDAEVESTLKLPI